MQSVLNYLSKKKISKYTKLILLTSDIFLLNTIYLLSYILRFGDLDRLNFKEPKLILILSNIFWVGISYHLNFYKIIRVEKFHVKLIKSTKVFILHFFLIALLIIFLKLNEVSRLQIFYFYIISFFIIIFFRYIFILLIKNIRVKGYNFRKVIFIGYNQTTKQIRQFINSDLSFGYKIIGYFDSDKTNLDIDYLGKFDQSINYIKQHKIDEIYISMTDKEIHYINEIISISEKLMIRIKIVPNLSQYSIYRKMTVDYYNNTPILLLLKEPLEDPVKEAIKRFFDILFAALIIILIYPWLIIIISIIVKITSKGPIFFKQLRTGMNGNAFNCYKFRTMRINSFSEVKQAKKDDNRVTRVGRFLRKTNLDEFPQFINVLLGDMSIVGPRPHMLKHTLDFSEIKDDYLSRHYVKPGITGWAQINGYRGETKTDADVIKRVEYDIWYIENWSFMLDLKIIFLTILNMLKGEKNAY
jgi:undecaprenyl-phosphate galactose phosphotransferase/putative colanic acid biosynthesis UDP-glucose lipid carrier transferase